MKYIGLFVLLFVFSCTSSPEEKEETRTEEFGAFALSYVNVPAEINLIRVVLTKNNTDSIVRNHDVNQGNTIAIEGVATGYWNVRIDAFQQDTIHLYTGQTDVLIEADKTKSVNITLNHTTGNLDIVIDFGESFRSDSIMFKRYISNGNISSYVSSIKETSDYGFIATGFEGNNLLLLKTDKYGNTEWKKTFGGEGSDRGEAIITTKDGGYLVGGYTRSHADSLQDGWLLKTNASGDLIWEVQFPQYNKIELVDLVELDDNSVFILGRFKRHNIFSEHVFVAKLNGNGSIIWSKNFFQEDHVYDVEFEYLLQSGIAILANVEDGVNLKPKLIRIDINGNQASNKTFNINSSGSVLIDFEKTLDGHLYIGVSVTEDGIHTKSRVLKTTIDGSIVWDYVFGGNGTQPIYSMKTTTDGGLAIASQIKNSENQNVQNIWFLKLNKDGIYTHDSNIGFDERDEPSAIIECMDKGFMVVGLTYQGPAFIQGLLIKTDRFGNLSSEN